MRRPASSRILWRAWSWSWPILALVVACVLLVTPPGRTQAPERIPDVIYGRKHGVVLTLDVFKPARPNGIGVLWMVSGGWFSSHNNIKPQMVKPFTDRGQTVFAVVHGSQPKYTIPEILQDVERATRFVRAHAAEYGVDPNRLGISGGSAGGHLSLMQGARGRDGDPKAQDPVDRLSSRVQAVACFFPPVDFLNYGETGQKVLDLPMFDPFRPAFPKADTPADREKAMRDTSPVTFLTAAMPPTLVLHGDADKLVPIQQANVLMKRLEELGVPHKLVVREGQAHGWADLGNDVALLAEWFEEYLGKK